MPYDVAVDLISPSARKPKGLITVSADDYNSGKWYEIAQQYAITEMKVKPSELDSLTIVRHHRNEPIYSASLGLVAVNLKYVAHAKRRVESAFDCSGYHNDYERYFQHFVIPEDIHEDNAMMIRKSDSVAYHYLKSQGLVDTDGVVDMSKVIPNIGTRFHYRGEDYVLRVGHKDYSLGYRFDPLEDDTKLSEVLLYHIAADPVKKPSTVTLAVINSHAYDDLGTYDFRLAQGLSYGRSWLKDDTKRINRALQRESEKNTTRMALGEMVKEFNTHGDPFDLHAEDYFDGEGYTGFKSVYLC